VSTRPRCSELSERAGEQLGATATNVENWLLVEVPGSWPRDVSEEAGLSPPVREALDDWLERTPSSRLLFIRRPGRSGGDPRLVFVVRAGEDTTDSRRIEVATHDELAGLDLARAGERADAPLVLVCGHGTRDACCALRGTAVYASLEPRLGAEELWLSSHQGGHRFAANVLVLPTGAQFGRVMPDDAPLVVARALAGRIALDRYRGRTAYSQLVQAAELATREAHGLDGLGDLRLVDVDAGRVRFRSFDGGEHVVWVEEVVGPLVPASCGAEATPQTAFVASLQ
jgi:hypothetical protein